jgi:hypothetical protein
LNIAFHRGAPPLAFRIGVGLSVTILTFLCTSIKINVEQVLEGLSWHFSAVGAPARGQEAGLALAVAEFTNTVEWVSVHALRAFC